MENLVIINKSIAKIEWNKQQALDEARDIMTRYEGLELSSDDVPVAKKELATLRKVSKEINAQALAIDKELTAPVKQFRTEVKEVQTIIDKGIAHIDAQVKAFEQAEKDARKAEIQAWDEYATIAKYYGWNDDYLLKKWDDKSLKQHFADVYDQIQKDIASVRLLATSHDLDADRYVAMLEIDAHDYPDLVQVMQRIVEDAELLKQKAETPAEHEPVIEHDEDDQIISIVRQLTGTTSQLVALKAYADKIGVAWE